MKHPWVLPGPDLWIHPSQLWGETKPRFGCFWGSHFITTLLPLYLHRIGLTDRHSKPVAILHQKTAGQPPPRHISSHKQRSAVKTRALRGTTSPPLAASASLSASATRAGFLSPLATRPQPPGNGGTASSASPTARTR